MLLEGYIALWNRYPKDELKVRVARPSHLSPSKELLHDWKEGLITWEEYENRFRKEILSTPEAMMKLKTIRIAARHSDVRLICYEKNPPCHRFILIDMIKEMDVDAREQHT